MVTRFRSVCPMLRRHIWTDAKCDWQSEWHETAMRAAMALAQHLLTEHNTAVIRMGKPSIVQSA